MNLTYKIQKKLYQFDPTLGKFHIILMLADFINFTLVTITMHIGNIFSIVNFGYFFFFILTILTFQILYVFTVYHGVYNRDSLVIGLYLFCIVYSGTIKLIVIAQILELKYAVNEAAYFMMGSIFVDFCIILTVIWMVVKYFNIFSVFKIKLPVYPRLLRIEVSKKCIKHFYLILAVFSVERMAFWFTPPLSWFWVFLRVQNIITLLYYTYYVYYALDKESIVSTLRFKFYVESIILLELYVMGGILFGHIDASIAEPQLIVNYSANICICFLFLRYIVDHQSNLISDYSDFLNPDDFNPYDLGIQVDSIELLHLR